MSLNFIGNFAGAFVLPTSPAPLAYISKVFVIGGGVVRLSLGKVVPFWKDVSTVSPNAYLWVEEVLQLRECEDA
jgi:hypothetical protein